MSDIMITVDTSQVKSAKQEMQELGSSVNSAINSASVFAKAFNASLGAAFREADRGPAFFREIAKANQDVINSLQGVTNKYLSAEQSASVFTEELRKQEAQAQKTARANQDAINSQLGVSGPSATSGGAGYGALEAEMLRLEAMYNKVAMAARVYEQAEESLNRAVLMGVITADQKEAKLGELSLAYQKVGNDADKAQAFIDRFGENAQVSGRGLNRFGMIAQQVGYQVGDFFVQIQSGTNFLVAFGQQATQLAGLIPGAWGAAIGIGISLATAIGAAFMRSGEAAEEASKGVDKYKEAIDNLKSSIQSTQAEINKLSFKTEDDAVAGARKAMQDAQTEVARLTASQRKVRGQFAPTPEEQAAIDEAVKNYRDLTVNLNELVFKQTALNEAQRMLNGGLSVAAGIQKGIVYNTEVQLRLARELKDLRESIAEGVAEPQKNLDIQREYQKLLQAGVKPVEAMAKAQYQIERALIQSSLASGKLNNEQQVAAKAAIVILDTTYALEKNLRQSAAETELLEKGLSQAAIDGGKLAGLDLSNLTDAAYDVLMLATNMGISVQAAANLALELGRLDRLNQNAGRGATSSRPIEFGTGPNAGKTVEEVRRLDKKAGGGDKKDPLEELRQQIKLETELLGVSEAQARVIQALGMDRSKYSEAEITAITAEIEAYNQKQEAIERTKQIMDTVKSSMEDAFMSMVDGTMSAKDAFRSMAADIIKELYRVLVVQQMVGSFDMATGKGSGIVGLLGGLFGGARASGGPIEAHKAYLVGEKGPELVIPRQSGTVVNAAQTAQAMGKGSGDITVQNNITVTGSDAAMVRTEIAKMIPQITNATKAAVIDAKQRGGQMAAAFR